MPDQEPTTRFKLIRVPLYFREFLHFLRVVIGDSFDHNTDDLARAYLLGAAMGVNTVRDVINGHMNEEEAHAMWRRCIFNPPPDSSFYTRPTKDPQE